jgi:hypothetical protein
MVDPYIAATLKIRLVSPPKGLTLYPLEYSITLTVISLANQHNPKVVPLHLIDNPILSDVYTMVEISPQLF